MNRFPFILSSSPGPTSTTWVLRIIAASFLIAMTSNPTLAQVGTQVGHTVGSTDHTEMPKDECAVGDSSDPFQPLTADLSDAVDEDAPVFRFKKRALQRVDFSGGWLQSAGNDINSGYLRTSLAVGMPIKGDLDNVVGLIPSFRVDFLDARPEFDVPDQLFEAGVGILWRRKIDDRWSFLATVQPSVRSDFTTSRRAVRVFGLAIWTWDYIPDRLKISFGAVALGRNDLPVLPALGLNWTPDPMTKVELGLPRSRITKRIAKDGTASETWAYLSGAIGGNTWAVTRPSGQIDELSLRDLRAMVGVEHIVDGGGGWFIEAGYSFFRRLEFETTQTEIDLSDGYVIQAGWAW